MLIFEGNPNPFQRGWSRQAVGFLGSEPIRGSQRRENHNENEGPRGYAWRAMRGTTRVQGPLLRRAAPPNSSATSATYGGTGVSRQHLQRRQDRHTIRSWRTRRTRTRETPAGPAPRHKGNPVPRRFGCGSYFAGGAAYQSGSRTSTASFFNASLNALSVWGTVKPPGLFRCGAFASVNRAALVLS